MEPEKNCWKVYNRFWICVQLIQLIAILLLYFIQDIPTAISMTPLQSIAGFAHNLAMLISGPLGVIGLAFEKNYPMSNDFLYALIMLVAPSIYFVCGHAFLSVLGGTPKKVAFVLTGMAIMCLGSAFIHMVVLAAAHS